MKKVTILSVFLGLVIVLMPGASFAMDQASTFTTRPAVDVDTEGGSQCANISMNLRYGMTDARTGNQVSMLQDFLISNGFLKANTNGYYGTQTRKAVTDFQVKYNLGNSGFTGPLTRAKIHDIDCSGDSTTTVAVNETTTTTLPYSTVPGCNLNNMFSTTTGQACYGENTTTVVNSSPVCVPGAQASVTLISPNGGEVFMDNQGIPVKWKSCNLSKESGVLVEISKVQNINGQGTKDFSTRYSMVPKTYIGEMNGVTVNDGEETFSRNGWPGVELGSNFKMEIKIAPVDQIKNNTLQGWISDTSDNTFTINKGNESISTVAGCNSMTKYSLVNGLSCNESSTTTTTRPIKPLPTTKPWVWNNQNQNQNNNQTYNTGCNHNEVFSSLTGQRCGGNQYQNQSNPISEMEQKMFQQSQKYSADMKLLDAACPLGYDAPNMECKKTPDELKNTNCPDGANSYRVNGECNEPNNVELNRSNPSESNDPRVMMWGGKVNQHWNQDTHRFETDLDGFSGNTPNVVAYCNKIYNTSKFTHIAPYKEEVSKTFAEAGNRNNWMYAFMSYRCMTGGDVVTQTQTTQDSACTVNSKPSITILSPNGGETYTRDSRMPIKWTSCNVPRSEYVRIGLLQHDANNTVNENVALHTQTGKALTQNSGETIVSDMENTGGWSNYTPGKFFKLSIQKCDGGTESSCTTDLAVGDTSNDLFTIK